MKALAAEITRKLGKRLAWLNVAVKELTGKSQNYPAKFDLRVAMSLPSPILPFL
jgi:hypothetical protein